MAGLIFGIIFLLVGVGAGIWLFSASETSYQEDERGNYVIDAHGERIKITEHPLRKFVGIAIAAGVFLGILCTFFGCISSVDTGHVGIVRTFGKVEDYTFDSGFHLKAPWQSVTEMDNRVQKTTVELSCFSSDIQEVTISYTVNYQISKTNAQNLYRDVGTNYLDTVVNPTIQETVKTVVARYKAEGNETEGTKGLVKDRAEVAAEIETLLRVNLERYHIDVSSTAIENMDFTDSFTQAVEAKAVAAQQKLQAQIEQDRLTMEATQAAERAKVEAAAQAEVNKMNATAAKEVAEIQAEADRIVAQIGADSAEYQGKKEAAIALQRLASINGWTVVTNEETGIHELYRADGTKIDDPEELKEGAQRLIEYYYTQSWDGKLPDTFVGDEDVSNIILGN